MDADACKEDGWYEIDVGPLEYVTCFAYLTGDKLALRVAGKLSFLLRPEDVRRYMKPLLSHFSHLFTTIDGLVKYTQGELRRRALLPGDTLTKEDGATYHVTDAKGRKFLVRYRVPMSAESSMKLGLSEQSVQAIYGQKIAYKKGVALPVCDVKYLDSGKQLVCLRTPDHGKNTTLRRLLCDIGGGDTSAVLRGVVDLIKRLEVANVTPLYFTPDSIVRLGGRFMLIKQDLVAMDVLEFNRYNIMYSFLYDLPQFEGPIQKLLGTYTPPATREDQKQFTRERQTQQLNVNQFLESDKAFNEWKDAIPVVRADQHRKLPVVRAKAPVARKKPVSRKKPASRKKKPVSRKKPASRKKKPVSRKKKVSRKKPASRKKKVSRKKPVSRKKKVSRRR